MAAMTDPANASVLYQQAFTAGAIPLRPCRFDPKIFAEFCGASTQEMNRLRMDARASIDAAQAQINRINREVHKDLDLYLKDALSIADVRSVATSLQRAKAEAQRAAGTRAERDVAVSEQEMAFFEAIQHLPKIMHDTTNAFLAGVRAIAPGVEDFQDVVDLVAKHAEHDQAICAAIERSGYLDVWRIEQEKNPGNMILD